VKANPKPRLSLRDPNVFIPIALFIGALLFRLIGIRWGLANGLHNQSYHPDELPIWAASQHVEPAKFIFTPGFYNYGTFYLTILRVASDVAAAYGGNSHPQDPAGAWVYISLCHLIGRVITAVAGAAMAAGIYAIMRRWTSTFGAVCAGLLVAVAPGHVVHSRFQTVDILAASLLTFSALYALKILLPEGETAEGRPIGKSVILAGLFAGLSTGTKYTGILGLFTLWAVLALTRPHGWLLQGCKGTVVCTVTFLVTTPGVLLDNEAFMRDFNFELAHSKAGQIEFFQTSSGYLYQLSNLFVGIGVLMTVMGMGALCLAGIKRKLWALGLLAFFIPYFVVIGGNELKFLRYTFPLYIAIAAGFGWAMGAANQRRGKYSMAIVLGFLGIGGVLDTGGLSWAAKDTLQMTQTDPRDRAGAYLRDPAVGKGRVVGLVSDPWYWSPAVYPDTALPRTGGPRVYLTPMLAAVDPRVVRYLPPNVNDRFDWDARLLTETRPDYIVFSNYETVNMERLKKAPNPLPLEKLLVDRYVAFAKQLSSNYRVVQQNYGLQGAEVPDMMYITPVITIWKRNDLP